MESFLLNPLPETISELEAQMDVIASEQKRCSDAIRRLMAAEDVEKGIVFPQDIANSDAFAVVQVYGMDPDKLWKD